VNGELMREDSPVELLPMAEDLTVMTLTELAASAEAKMHQSEALLSEGLVFYIEAGKVLIEARGRVEATELSWHRWVDENLGRHRRSAVVKAIRLANNADAILSHGEPLTVKRALLMIEGAKPAFSNPNELSLEQRDQIATLNAEGLNPKEIADLVGTSVNTVKARTIPGWADRRKAAQRERRRRSEAAAKALAEKQQREERDRRARTGTDNERAIYAAVRDAATRADREGLTELVRTLHQAEEQILEAIDRSEHGR
jgi:hypothetical protein